jgi:hypothetical protein
MASMNKVRVAGANRGRQDFKSWGPANFLDASVAGVCVSPGTLGGEVVARHGRERARWRAAPAKACGDAFERSKSGFEQGMRPMRMGADMPAVLLVLSKCGVELTPSSVVNSRIAGADQARATAT